MARKLNKIDDIYSGDHEAAARTIILMAPDPGTVITKEQLYAFGDFPTLTGPLSQKAFTKWTLAALSYRERVRDLVMARPPEGLGRLLHTLPGKGFVLLSAAESVKESESTFFSKVDRAARKALNRINNADVRSQEERTNQVMSRVRVGSARAAAEAASAQEARRKEVLESLRGERPKTGNPLLDR